MDTKIDIKLVTDYLSGLQDQICKAVGQIENTPFEEDTWQRPAGGGGRTRVLRNGDVFEQAGINYSFVTGDQLPASATALRPDLAGASFQAAGVSIVMHPHNPYAPTSHFNVRFFYAESPNGNSDWWFGGGFDLTPYYGFVDDARAWHQKAQQACESLGPDSYDKFKRWCDEYFYLKHRQEPRGIGGIFFDDLNQPDFESCFKFLQAVGTAYPEAYIPIIEKRKDMTFGEREKQFQLYRRGRYVEFNLVYDRGTLFGLQSGGRTESILMSLPPQVRWEYNWQPEPNSAEASLYQDFLVAKDWINEK